MTEKPQNAKNEVSKRDEPVSIPLDPETALRALLQVQPEHDHPSKEKVLKEQS